jgi:predicted RNase H-like HicB family nuclease
MARYTVLLFWEDDAYAALVPALGIASQGDTIEAALAMAKEATELHIQGLIEDGEPVLEEESPPIIASIEIAVPVPAVTS